MSTLFKTKRWILTSKFKFKPWNFSPDNIFKRRHASQRLVEVVRAILERGVAGAALVQSLLEAEASWSPDQQQQEQGGHQGGPEPDGALHLVHEVYSDKWGRQVLADLNRGTSLCLHVTRYTWHGDDWLQQCLRQTVDISKSFVLEN